MKRPTQAERLATTLQAVREIFDDQSDEALIAHLRRCEIISDSNGDEKTAGKCRALVKYLGQQNSTARGEP